MYELFFSDIAKKQFCKLEKHVQERIGSVLERVKLRPEHFLEKLVGEKGYKIRVGDYRIIFDIQQEKLILLVIKIGHRKNVYG